MRTLRLTIAYDGTNYVGWQRQSNGLSVQELVEDALAPFADGTAPAVAGASRTDAGVHALGQVASVNVGFSVSAAAVRRALNVRLPTDVRVLDVIDEVPGFHARFHARSKLYRYRMSTAEVLSPFERAFVWHSPGSPNISAMRRAAQTLVGCHDFASFQAGGSTVRDTVRTLERIDIAEADGEIVFELLGTGFLRHMARAIVGTLADIGAGFRSVDSMPAIVAARDRQAAGPTAPACGLTLMHVQY
jgi:tRNA pseudouridine38-40 synthase